MKQKALKILVTALSVVLVICLSVAGTLAYLQLKTNSVVNTFSPSNIELKLEETATEGGTSTANTYQMIPGVVYAKDPQVTVTSDIDCYVFVQVEESNNFDDFMTYAIAGGWKLFSTGTEEIDTVGNDAYVLYREVSAEEAKNGEVFNVLAGDATYANGIVTVKSEVTKAQMDKLYDENGNVKDQPTLTFTAYAIQVAGFENNVTGAWTQATAQQQG